MSAYTDSSFLVSLYVFDANSNAAASRMQRLPLPLLVSTFAHLEVINALQLRVFRKEIQPLQARTAEAAFRNDQTTGVLALRALSDDVFEAAVQLTRRWTARLGVRSLDILHVAAALVLKSQSFETFDERQKKLAKAAGLTAP